MAEERISIGTSGADLIIILEGHITAVLCPELKKKVMERLSPDSRLEAIRFDFLSCLYMDSTFLGLIVFLAKLAQSMNIERPVVHQACAECMSLFRTMGMLKMLDFSEEACPPAGNAEKILAGNGLSAGFLYEVHKELGGLSAENKARFQMLEEELEALLDPPDATED